MNALYKLFNKSFPIGGGPDARQLTYVVVEGMELNV
jgi:hypothetical protein